jgi:hypothetical protein
LFCGCGAALIWDGFLFEMVLMARRGGGGTQDPPTIFLTPLSPHRPSLTPFIFVAVLLASVLDAAFFSVLVVFLLPCGLCFCCFIYVCRTFPFFLSLDRFAIFVDDLQLCFVASLSDGHIFVCTLYFEGDGGMKVYYFLTPPPFLSPPLSPPPSLTLRHCRHYNRYRCNQHQHYAVFKEHNLFVTAITYSFSPSVSPSHRHTCCTSIAIIITTISITAATTLPLSLLPPLRMLSWTN